MIGGLLAGDGDLDFWIGGDGYLDDIFIIIVFFFDRMIF